MSALLSDILPSYKLKPASSWECSLSQSQSKDKGTSSINPKGIRARNLPFCVTKTSLLKLIHESFNLGGGVGQQVCSGRNLTQHSTTAVSSRHCRARRPSALAGRASQVCRPGGRCYDQRFCVRRQIFRAAFCICYEPLISTLRSQPGAGQLSSC